MIVGTAGHVDHGKTALVRALTGVDTDRLAEEKARGISIDLGFAYLPDGAGGRVGFVDVPGHAKFLHNMLAGASGVDFVLLVVAADDGVMPQTREHLAILELLGLTQGLVVLTKVDLVTPQRAAEVSTQIRGLLRGTGLGGMPIVPVSTVTGEGIEALRERLRVAAQAAGGRSAAGRFRLALDRCFSLSGVGTLVTGAVLSGAVTVGDTVAISPGGLKARVRSIHAQNAPARRGVAGERCALNLAGEGIDTRAIHRGAMVLDPVLDAPTARIDARLRLLASEARPLTHWTAVRVHHAAAEVAARVALLEEAPIAPGAAGRVQLVLAEPIAAAARDRFILRDTSGSRTLGGGHFIDLRAPQRRRRVPQRLAQLEALDRASPAEALAALLGRWPRFVDVSALARDRALDATQSEALLRAVPQVQLVVAAARIALAPGTLETLAGATHEAVEAFHRAHPEQTGLAPTRLARLVEPRLPPAVYAAALGTLVKAGRFVLDGGAVRLPEHRLVLDQRDAALWARVAPFLSGAERFRPLLVKEIAVQITAPEAEVLRILKALARQRVVVEVALERFFRRDTVEEMSRIVVAIARAQSDGQFSAAQLRDRLDNGRKVAIQILEYFDGQGLTLRRGDLRRINPRRLDLVTRAS
ncbi:MAG: selenocysteine-specific translation elongation factor [Gammaproteobacteria bacterium]|nr:selenocysteine-specific translation elongation factor [Gammaproteobacteria bacterium]